MQDIFKNNTLFSTTARSRPKVITQHTSLDDLHLTVQPQALSIELGLWIGRLVPAQSHVCGLKAAKPAPTLGRGIRAILLNTRLNYVT